MGLGPDCRIYLTRFGGCLHPTPRQASLRPARWQTPLPALVSVAKVRASRPSKPNAGSRPCAGAYFRVRDWCGRCRPFVLVLDDMHTVHAAQSIAVITAILDHLPLGSQLAIASRSEPDMPVGRLRANRNVIELRFGDLRMTPSEAAKLLAGAGA